MPYEYICRNCGAEFISSEAEASEVECPECYAMDAEPAYVEIEASKMKEINAQEIQQLKEGMAELYKVLAEWRLRFSPIGICHPGHVAYKFSFQDKERHDKLITKTEQLLLKYDKEYR